MNIAELSILLQMKENDKFRFTGMNCLKEQYKQSY